MLASSSEHGPALESMQMLLVVALVSGWYEVPFGRLVGGRTAVMQSPGARAVGSVAVRTMSREAATPASAA
jgi:hypothetical protein